MNKLAKTQRERLIGIAVGTAALMAAFWYLLVQPKQVELTRTRQDISQKRDKLMRAEGVLRSAAEVGANYTNKLEALQQRESGMAPERGPYEWMINTINPFIRQRKGVNILTISEPAFSDLGLLPKFPYRWATFHISAVGFYQDFGKFFADFENSFPYFRIQNMDISAMAGPASDEEKLAFSFDIVTPVVAAETK